MNTTLERVCNQLLVPLIDQKYFKNAGEIAHTLYRDTGILAAVGTEDRWCFPAEASLSVSLGANAVSADGEELRLVLLNDPAEAPISRRRDSGVVFAGSWMTRPPSGEADCAAACREAVYQMHAFTIAHVGINNETPEQAMQTASAFETLFGLKTRVTKKSVFAGKDIEVMYVPSFGEKGHIAISAADVGKAYGFLKAAGCSFKEETRSFNAEGKMRLVYLEADISGFAVHLAEAR